MLLQRRGLIIHPQEFRRECIEEWKRAKLNVLGLHPVGGRKADESLEDAVRRHADPEFRACLVELRESGIEVEYEAHALRWLLPRSMFNIHPNWFRENSEGERTADFHMCVSNRDAIAYIENRAEMLARMLYTGAHRYYFWPDDVHGTICNCESCRQLTPSDQALLITNAILRGVRRFDSLARVAFLAYQDTLEIPQNVKPEEGVFLEFAPIWRDHHSPIADASCSKNQNEIRGLKQLIDFFGAEHAQVLDYWMDNSLFSNWTKPPQRFTLDEKVLESDAAYYQSLGFKSITCFGCYLGDDYRELYGEPPINRYGEILYNA